MQEELVQQHNEDKASISEMCNATSLRAWLALNRVYDKMQRHMVEHLECYDLSLAQYDVLAHLKETPGITQQELAEQLMVTKGNVCKLIDRMEQRELVVRQPDPHDRRSNLLYLTPTGADIAERAVPAYASFVEGHLKGLSALDQAKMMGLLEQLESFLDAH